VSTPAVRPTPHVSRRTALLGIGVLGAATAGCTPYTVDQPAVSVPTPSGPPGTDPDVALVTAVLGREQDMLDRLVATARRHRGLASLLAEARRVHGAHVRLLREAAPAASTSPTPTAPSASPGPAGPGRVDRQPARALAVLARHEDELGLVARRSAFTAQSGAFARVLASMAAAAAQQATVIRAAARDQAAGRPG
jgi:hypothetical protein